MRVIALITCSCVTHAAGLTYLDENLSAQMSSVYMGIFYAVAVIGPAVGFILGGYFISLFTDFDRVSDNESVCFSVRKYCTVQFLSVSTQYHVLVDVISQYYVVLFSLFAVSVMNCIRLSLHQ